MFKKLSVKDKIVSGPNKLADKWEKTHDTVEFDTDKIRGAHGPCGVIDQLRPAGKVHRNASRAQE